MSRAPVLSSIISPNDYNTHRKPIIKRIQKKIGTKLVVYTASSFHPFPLIMIQDIPLFEDLLRSASTATKGTLMINSPGGDANVAEKFLTMCRQRFPEKFEVIVPDYAKSAATMVALGSDKIHMGYLAELGPIDPQLRVGPPGANVPARSFIDGLEIIRKKVREDGDPVQLYYPMMTQIRPEILVSCQNAIEAARMFAEKWLKNYMLKNDPEQAKKVAKWLSEGKKYKLHGKVIDFEEAKNVLKLNVEKIEQNSKLWSDVWELYCRSVQFLQARQKIGAAKLFESESVSLTMQLQVMRIPQPRLVQPPPRGPPTQPPSTPPSQPTQPLRRPPRS